MKKKQPSAPPDSADPEATAVQAGIEKTLYDELTQGLAYAASSLAAIDDEERQRLLGQAALAYQNAVYLAEQSSTPPESPINNNSRPSPHSSSNTPTNNKKETENRMEQPRQVYDGVGSVGEVVAA